MDAEGYLTALLHELQAAATLNPAAHLNPYIKTACGILCFGTNYTCKHMRSHDTDATDSISHNGSSLFSIPSIKRVQHAAFEGLSTTVKAIPLLAPQRIFAYLSDFIHHLGPNQPSCPSGTCDALMWAKGSLFASSTMPLLLCLLPSCLPTSLEPGDNIFTAIFSWLIPHGRVDTGVPAKRSRLEEAWAKPALVGNADRVQKTANMLTRWLLMAPISTGWAKLQDLVFDSFKTVIYPALDELVASAAATPALLVETGTIAKASSKRPRSPCSHEGIGIDFPRYQPLLMVAAMLLHTDPQLLASCSSGKSPLLDHFLNALESCIPESSAAKEFLETLVNNIHKAVHELRSRSTKRLSLKAGAHKATASEAAVAKIEVAQLHDNAIHCILDFLHPRGNVAKGGVSKADVVNILCNVLPLRRVCRGWKQAVDLWHGWQTLLRKSACIMQLDDLENAVVKPGKSFHVLCNCGVCPQRVSIPGASLPLLSDLAEAEMQARQLKARIITRRSQLHSRQGKTTPPAVRVCRFCDCHAALEDAAALKSHLRSAHSIPIRKLPPVVKFFL